MSIDDCDGIRMIDTHGSSESGFAHRDGQGWSHHAEQPFLQPVEGVSMAADDRC